MKKTALISFSTALVMPVLAFAQTFHPQYLNSVVVQGKQWLDLSITVIMVLMTLWFLISVLRYIAEKDPKELANKRKVMLNGLVGLFIAVSVWGIIKIAGNIVGTTGNNDAAQMVCPPGTTAIGNSCV